jgi:rhamnogalacturonan hydrolase
VTNRDECVTVKDPSSNFLIEQIWCNLSGGCAMGSLGANTQIENITYRNVYSNGCEGMYYLKTNGGSGYVKNCLFENFTGHGNAYGLVLNEHWGTAGNGDGVKLSGMTFKVLFVAL